MRAHHVNQQLREFLIDRVPRFAAFYGGGKARSGHGGLFGGNGEVQHEYQREAQAVVQPCGNAVGKRVGDVPPHIHNFEQRHQRNQHAAARGGTHHAHVFFFAARDVVFAVVAGVLRDAAGEHAHAAFPQARHALLLGSGAGERAGEREQIVELRFFVFKRGQQQHDAVKGLVQPFQQVRHVHRCACARAGAEFAQFFHFVAALLQHHLQMAVVKGLVLQMRD